MKAAILFLVSLSIQAVTFSETKERHFSSAWDFDPPSFMGDWSGSYVDPPEKTWPANNPSLVARIIGKGDNLFEVEFMNVFDRRADIEVSATVKSDNGSLSFSGTNLEFTADGKELVGRRKFTGRNNETIWADFRLLKVERLSPTLGLPPPPGAISLITPDLDLWQHPNGNSATWKVLDGSVLECFPRKEGNEEGGDLQTKQTFKDLQLHLEFRLPYEPARRGQGRANSGLFLQGAYEVQILDSYGTSPGWSDCGALYKVSPPKVNKSLPPGLWQTYDIDFRAARFDEEGELTSPPVITVKQNGTVIHQDQPLFEVTQWLEKRRMNPHSQDAGPIRLQDHGHAVQFRNFWVLETD
ncbi:MAG: DUF1080 domain-containing protein [Verrucomicrobiota bacterium]